MEFSLFYFSDDCGESSQRYRLLLEGAKFADERGFTAVWTPERHFHQFGGQYPNPSVTSAAIAAITRQVGIRAGSVVAPLHHPVRIAEEWSVVDNLSGGRVGMSFASGWHAVDFTIRPENFADRRTVLIDTIETVRRLWRGEAVEFADGTGKRSSVRIFPSPVQPVPPMWLTSAGNLETFHAAGQLGIGVLTHLLGQDLDDLDGKLRAYRSRYTGPEPAKVALMLHTFLGTDREQVREVVRKPFSDYIRSSIGLIVRSDSTNFPGVDPEDLDPEDLEFLVERSFDRYFDTGGLFGTVDDGLKTLERLDAIGVTEVACLIDFGVPTDTVLRGLEYLDELKNAWARR